MENKKDKGKDKNGLIKEFKTFIARGNVVDMAVGVIVGGMFTKIVNSIVQDILNPIIGFLLGNVDFSELKIVLKEASDSASEVSIKYGNLIQSVVQFILTALVLFLVVKAMNKFKDAQEEIAHKLVETVKKKTGKNS